MKRIITLAKYFLVLSILICLESCSFIYISIPTEEQSTIGSPHNLAVRHERCGIPIPNSFTAFLDINTENEINISASFQNVSNHSWFAENYNLPIGQHKLTVHANVEGSCLLKKNNDSRIIYVLENCPPNSYCAYFADNTKIANATINTLDQLSLSYFWDYLDKLENSGIINIEEPSESQNCIEPNDCLSIHLTNDEKRHILAAKMAHAIWLDKNILVPWRLKFCSQAELNCLFNPDKLFDPFSIGSPTTPHDYFFSVVDYSPSKIYQYCLDNNLIKSNREETMWAVLDILRTTDTQSSFIHGAEFYGDPLSTAYTLYNAITDWSNRGNVLFHIARSGCHSMARIIVGILRSINIEGEVIEDGQWMANYHASAIWPGLQLVLPHGDDIYTATLKAVPSNELLPHVYFYYRDQNTAVCGSDKDCLSKRYKALMAIKYPDTYTLERCCNPTFGYPNCRAYLTDQYNEVLTEEEINQGVNVIESLCN